MLLDSLAPPGGDCHVEQVEIRFSPAVDPDQVISAWQETVVHTMALRITFLIEDGSPSGWEEVPPPQLSIVDEPLPGCWETWLEKDRHRPLLLAHHAPWRAVFWPVQGRFVWTFHHALLDGRSITRILRAFLDRVEGAPASHLPLSLWHPPDEDVKVLADQLFRQAFGQHVGTGTIGPGYPPAGITAIRRLGPARLKRLETLADEMETTVATILIWAWAQAIIAAAERDSVILEQVRAGVPQPGTAGFTMTLLPVKIPRGNQNTLRDLRARLLDLRLIESMSPDDFSPGVFPDVDRPWSSVIMIEHATAEHLIGERPHLESITLHEPKGGTLMATAFLQPDLRLEVEGPGRTELLDGWIGVLDRLERGIYPA